MLWAVSQAAPLRRVEVDHDLILFQYAPPYDRAGYASGGFLADSIVAGTVWAGGQQQFCVVNSTVGGFEGAAWNVVLVGVTGSTPEPSCGQEKAIVSTSDDRNRGLTKPFIVIDDDKYVLVTAAGDIDFSDVVVATSSGTIDIGRDDAALVLSPGIYELDEPFVVHTEGFVVLGLGLATIRRGGLVVDAGSVTVAGIIVEAAGVATTLATWDGHSGILADFYCRVGNFDNASTVDSSADAGLVVNGNNLTGDNVWIWRGDHDIDGLVYNQTYPLAVGLDVRGNGVTFFGLAVEHALDNLVRWSGDRGFVAFFQSEYPYDVDDSFDVPGYNVTGEDHTGLGVGVRLDLSWPAITRHTARLRFMPTSETPPSTSPRL